MSEPVFFIFFYERSEGLMGLEAIRPSRTSHKQKKMTGSREQIITFPVGSEARKHKR